MQTPQVPLKALIADINTLQTLPIEWVSVTQKVELAELLASVDPEALPKLEVLALDCIGYIAELQKEEKEQASHTDDGKRLLALSFISPGFLPGATDKEDVRFRTAVADTREVKHRDASGDNAPKVRTREAGDTSKPIKRKETTGKDKARFKEAPTDTTKKLKHRIA